MCPQIKDARGKEFQKVVVADMLMVTVAPEQPEGVGSSASKAFFQIVDTWVTIIQHKKTPTYFNFQCCILLFFL